MIPNGKIDVEKHEGTDSRNKERKIPNALSRGPYFHENRRQTTDSFQNGDGGDKDMTAFQNGRSFEREYVGKDEELDWSKNHTTDDNSQLSFEHMWELKRIIDKRVKNKLSEGLSPEGKKAMELARAEAELSKRKGKNVRISNGESSYNGLPDLELPNNKKREKTKKKISFVDAYESSSASRLSGDILDENSSEGNPKRWALGGGNINVAMETVEIVSYGDTLSESDADDMAIEETAKLNSVEKCLVWMGVHANNDYDEQR